MSCNNNNKTAKAIAKAKAKAKPKNETKAKLAEKACRLCRLPVSADVNIQVDADADVAVDVYYYSCVCARVCVCEKPENCFPRRCQHSSPKTLSSLFAIAIVVCLCRRSRCPCTEFRRVCVSVCVCFISRISNWLI